MSWPAEGDVKRSVVLKIDLPFKHGSWTTGKARHINASNWDISMHYNLTLDSLDGMRCQQMD
jgi:hypothetical protein